MSQTDFDLRRRHSTQHNPICGSLDDCALPRAHIRIALYGAIVLLGWTTASVGESSGPGFAIKLGAQTIESPVDLDKTTQARFELEIAGPRLCDGRFDLALTFGGSSLGSFRDESTDFDDGVTIEESFTSDLALFDIRLVGRLYPFGDSSQLRPYVGAGIGYFWFLSCWQDVYRETMEDPHLPGVFHTFTDVTEGTDTVAHGFFPFVTAGLTVPVGSNLELLFEIEYDFDKRDCGFDLSGPVYLFGCRFRW